MRAAVLKRFGPASHLTVEEMPSPEPSEGQVLVRVAASSVNPIDWKLRSGKMRLLLGPKLPAVLGYDFSGTIEAVGKGVKHFKPGERVFGMSDVAPGGAYAEFAVATESCLARIPEGVGFGEAAAVPLAALTSLQGMRDLGKLREGMQVLVVGGSGGVGSYAIQIAKAAGASVTAVCGTSNVELCEELGADRVVDYKKEDALAAGPSYDLVFDAVATQNYSKAAGAMGPKGVYVTTLPKASLIFSMLWTKWKPGQKAKFVMCKSDGKDLEGLANLMRDGKLRSIIDSRFPLEKVAEAHERSETGRARGKIIVEVTKA